MAIHLYGDIHPDGPVSAERVVAELAALGDITELDVHLNSAGGAVHEAVAIMAQLRAHPAQVRITVDGLAASAASFIAVGAADHLLMAPHSELMAHLPWAMVIGNAGDLRREADNLDRLARNIAAAFVRRAGGGEQEWLDALIAETWWSAEEAVAGGLADGIAEPATPPQSVAAASIAGDRTRWAHRSRAEAPPPPRTLARATTIRERNPMSTLQESLAELLGTEADEEAILAAARDRLAATDDTPPAPAAPSLEQATAIASAAGLSVVSTEALDALREQARAGAEARQQQLAQARAAVVDAAIGDGRIAPARRDHWLAQMAADPDGVATVIASLPAVIPLATVGHAVANPVSATDDDMLYQQLFGKDSSHA